MTEQVKQRVCEILCGVYLPFGHVESCPRVYLDKVPAHAGLPYARSDKGGSHE